MRASHLTISSAFLHVLKELEIWKLVLEPRGIETELPLNTCLGNAVHVVAHDCMWQNNFCSWMLILSWLSNFVGSPWHVRSSKGGCCNNSSDMHFPWSPYITPCRLLTERNATSAVAMARMGQISPASGGPPRADDTTAGQLISSTRLASYNSTSSQSSMPTAPPSSHYNGDSDSPMFSCNTRLASYNSSASSQLVPQLVHQPSTTLTPNAGSNINAGGFSWLDFLTPGAAAAAARIQGSSQAMPLPMNAIGASDGTIALQGSAMRDEFLTSVSQPRQDAAAANYAGGAIFTSMQRSLGSGSTFGNYALWSMRVGSSTESFCCQDIAFSMHFRLHARHLKTL